METLDFWVGNFQSEEDFYNFVEEDENYYLLEESDDIHISRFAASQDTVWLDHDFVEYGFEDGNRTLYEKFADYSFAEQWLPILVNRLNEINLKFEVNCIIFLNRGQIPKPVSVEDDLFSLAYVGGIEFSV
jgi:hypothetical protein